MISERIIAAIVDYHLSSHLSLALLPGHVTRMLFRRFALSPLKFSHRSSAFIACTAATIMSYEHGDDEDTGLLIRA